jgi:hypothetical protein
MGSFNIKKKILLALQMIQPESKRKVQNNIICAIQTIYFLCRIISFVLKRLIG